MTETVWNTGGTAILG